MIQLQIRYHKLAFALIGGALFGVGAIALVSSALEAARPPEIPGFLWPAPKVLQDFTLTDQYGKPFGLAQIADRWSFLFFGYTYCPDVCPTTLSMMARISKDLDSDGAADGNLQFVFVSVDPARDTPENLGKYVTYFDPSFLGVTGAASALDALTRQLGIFVSRDAADESGNYLVSHTGAVLLIDPEGQFVGVYQAPHDPPDIASSFRRIRAFLEG